MHIGHAASPVYKLGDDRVMVIKVEKPSNRPIYVIDVYSPSSNYSNEEYHDAISMLHEAFSYCNDRGRVIILGDTMAKLGPPVAHGAIYHSHPEARNC